VPEVFPLIVPGQLSLQTELAFPKFTQSPPMTKRASPLLASEYAPLGAAARRQPAIAANDSNRYLMLQTLLTGIGALARKMPRGPPDESDRRPTIREQTSGYKTRHPRMVDMF